MNLKKENMSFQNFPKKKGLKNSGKSEHVHALNRRLLKNYQNERNGRIGEKNEYVHKHQRNTSIADIQMCFHEPLINLFTDLSS